MRLIDANALKTIRSIQSADYNSIETIQHWIDNAPTIDAVPVVRCKDCKHFKSETENTGICDGGFCHAPVHVAVIDFCSYGERKDDE